MKSFMAIFKIRFLLLLQYRMAAIAGLLTQFFFGFVYVMVFQAFYQTGNSQPLLTFPQTVTYIWLGQGLLALLPWNADREVQLMIRNGDIAYELSRPLDLYNYWFARILAGRLAPTLLKSIPLFIFVGMVLPKPYKLNAPESITSFILFILTMIGAVILGCALSNIITLSVLFTIGDGINRFFPAIVTFFSGMIIPLPFFPDWLQPLLKFLPFGDLVDAPYKYYLGIYKVQQLPVTLIHQMLWIVFFIIVGRLSIKKAGKRIIVQGG